MQSIVKKVGKHAWITLMNNFINIFRQKVVSIENIFKMDEFIVVYILFHRMGVGMNDIFYVLIVFNECTFIIYTTRLRQLDIQSLKTLQGRVNIIPVIGKSDILTPTEVRSLKDKILDDLRANHIQVCYCG
jgi:hypothetical protein